MGSGRGKTRRTQATTALTTAESQCATNANGDKEWLLNGQRHRVDGPAVEHADGYKAWHLSGQRHRVDGPAIEYANGSKEWWLNGQRHRVDGPAVERADGGKQWFVNSNEVSEEEVRDAFEALNWRVSKVENLGAVTF